MATTAPFNAHPDRYDEWFERHEAAYRSELRALRSVLPERGTGVEIGVGTGRFATPLGIGHGVDPSFEMRVRARERGIEVKDGGAEVLPYSDDAFDKALMTTTICFLDDPLAAFKEVARILRPGGIFVVGVLDRDSPLGTQYEERRAKSPFYENARFHTADEVLRLLDTAGFDRLTSRQTLFSDPERMTDPDPVRPGHGEGGFAVLRGVHTP